MAGELFDAYRSLIADTRHISARRQSADNVYVSAISLVLGAVAFLVALGALLARAFAGIVIAGEWAKQDRISIAYLLFQHEMLKQLEDKAGVLFPILHLEENFYREGNGRIAHFGFSQSAARWLPRMFGLLYLVGVSAVAGILTTSLSQANGRHGA